MSKVEGRNLKSVLDVRSARGVESRRKKNLSFCLCEGGRGGRKGARRPWSCNSVWSWQWENPKPPGSSIYRADGLTKPASLRKERKEREGREIAREVREGVYIYTFPGGGLAALAQARPGSRFALFVWFWGPVESNVPGCGECDLILDWGGWAPGRVVYGVVVVEVVWLIFRVDAVMGLTGSDGRMVGELLDVIDEEYAKIIILRDEDQDVNLR